MMMNLPTGRTLTCTCGNEICRICGENDHFPSNCGDIKTWARIVNANEAQWLHDIVTQQCPMCKMAIDKNGGCIHMTCKCGHSFCWICMKVWKGHTNYGECNSIKKEDHERKLLEEQEKRKSNDGYYSVKFEEAKSEVERAESMSKRVAAMDMEAVIKELNQYHILTNDLLRLKQAKEVVIEALTVLIYSHIYIFFEREGYLLLKRDLEFYTQLMSELDDFLQQRVHSVEIVSAKFKKLNDRKL